MDALKFAQLMIEASGPSSSPTSVSTTPNVTTGSGLGPGRGAVGGARAAPFPSGVDSALRAYFERAVGRSGAPVVRVVNRKSGGRHIENLDALVDALRGRGIAVDETDPGGQGPPGRQMAMMSQTDVMVAPHGAGLTNAFAMPPCAAVIELYPHRFALPGSLGNLAAESGHLYIPWFKGVGTKGEPYDKAKTAKLSRAGQTGASFTISVSEVESLTIAAMAARAVCLAATQSH